MSSPFPGESAIYNPFTDPAFLEIERSMHRQSTPTLSAPDYAPLPPLDAPCPFPIQSFDDIPRRDIDWLWKNRLARGKLHIWAGHPGLGKTAAACDIAARLSRGTPWPDQQSEPARPSEPDRQTGAALQTNKPQQHGPAQQAGNAQQHGKARQAGPAQQAGNAQQAGPVQQAGNAGRVLIIAGEDGPDDTLKLRLEAAGADCSRVHVMDCRSLRSQRGINMNFAAAIRDFDVDLILFDALAPFLNRPLDSLCFGDSFILAELADIAQDQNAAIVALSNLGKSGHVAAACRAMSALAHLAPPRLIFGFVGDPDDSRHSRVLMLPIKANICRKPDPLAFRVHEQGLTWEQGPDIAAFDDLLHWKPGKPADKLELAKSLILSALADGPLEPHELETRIVAQGISTRTYYRAKAQLPHLQTATATANCQTAK